MSETVTVTIYIVIDGDGSWAAMGIDGANPQSSKELHDLLREWNLDQSLGYCKAYKLKVNLPVPTMTEIEAIEKQYILKDEGMME